MNQNWIHIKTIVDSETFELDGLNIWDFDWKRTGQSVQIEDPSYGQDYVFGVYEISAGEQLVKFVAGEFSNCVWGI